jgi:hypothetical protein
VTENIKSIDHYLKQLVEQCHDRLEDIEIMPPGLRPLLQAMLNIMDVLRAQILIMQALQDAH